MSGTSRDLLRIAVKNRPTFIGIAMSFLEYGDNVE